MQNKLTTISQLAIVHWLFITLVSVLLTACNKEVEESLPAAQEQPKTYSADSWRSTIPESCLHYFDGCNQCTRSAGSELAACTRKACFEYKEPTCLDKPVQVALVESKQSVYQCDDNNQFTVFYGEYRVGDQRIRLAADQVHFRDHQTKTVSSLIRVPSASGEKYNDDSLEFWVKGDSAIVSKNEQVLYRNCELARP